MKIMKKIVVFTDFSERSENAAMYALQLGRTIRADIILYHAYLSPASQPYAAQVAWPLMNAGQLEITSRKELELAASKLNRLATVNPVGAFTPRITTYCTEGELTNDLGELLEDKEIVLFLMANHRKGFDSLITGNHLNKMLDKAQVPVLIIPVEATYKTIKKITFATALDPADIDVLHSLSTMARHSNASIMLAHISPDKEQQQSKEKRYQVQQFLCQISNTINYPHIYYRHVQEAEVTSGLRWVSEHVAFDLLTMVHHQKSFFTRLFSNSSSKSVASDANIPLLIYPRPAAHLPVF